MSDTASMLSFGNNEPDIPRNPSHLDGSPDTEVTGLSKRPKLELHELVTAYMENTRQMLHDTIDVVLEGRRPQRSFQIYNAGVESLCKLKYSEQLKLSGVISTKLEYAMKTFVVPLVQALIHKDLEEFAVAFIAFFENWEEKLKVLTKLFLYLDTNYLMNSKRKRIYVQGLDLFRENILFDPMPTAGPTYLKYISLLERTRQSGLDIELSRKFTIILVKLDYDNKLKLHNRLIDCILAHYLQLKDTYRPETYFHSVFVSISKEVSFFQQCGKSDKFLRDFVHKLQWNLIFEDFSTKLAQSFPSMVNTQHEVLNALYNICKLSMNNFQYESILVVLYEWSKFIRQTVTELLKSQNANLIPLLVDQYDEFKRIIASSFNNDESFDFELREAFGKAFNQDKNVTAFVLSNLCKFCDSYFKRQDDTPFKVFLEKVLVIYKLISNKSDFLTVYKKDLSKRILIYGRSNITHEKKLAEELMNIIGESDENDGITIMFQDLEVSQSSYSCLLPQKNFHPLILSKSHWPDIPKICNEVVLPTEISDTLGEFTAKYQNLKERFKNQSLDWSNYSLHTLTLNVEFKAGPKELILNLLQATVLLLFQDKNELSIDEMLTATKMEPNVMQKILASFTEKYQILKPLPNDLFEFNADFTDRANRIKLPFTQKKERVSLVLTDKDVLRNRQDENRATITRICKAHGRVKITNLLNEATKALTRRGAVSIRDLKLAIDFLVQHEFLRRVDKETLEYIA